MDKETELNKALLEKLLQTCRENLPSVNEELIRKGFLLSYESHKENLRASGENYFSHPLAVAEIVASEIPLDDISVVAALLHDVVEDTDISLEFIESEFGKEVADIVDGVTKIADVFKGHEINQAENYRKLLLSMIEDVRVILVKFADRLHNMRTLQYVSPEKQRRVSKETMDIYAPFANRFGLGKVKWELEDLSFKYLNKSAYDDLKRKVKSKRKEREAYIAKFIKPLKAKLEEHNIEFEIAGRAKHLYSIYKKMLSQNLTFEQIYDLLAIRVILESSDPNDCYYILGIINQLYTPIPDRFKDYISIPKKNNYQSIHNTVISPEGRLVEIQIRTRKMHDIAEKGVAAHWKYKESLASSDEDLEEWVNWIRNVFENVSKDEASQEILASFKLNLYQDEIYVFTPKGDLRRLPANSTPVDFAFDIHSNVGYHCIGAKVNGKIVPLDTKLKSGDQVDIITSKNQHPSKGWLQFVQTHKAKANIRRFLNKEEQKLVDAGREIWQKKLKKYKLSFNSEEINKLIRKLKYPNQGKFFADIARDKVNLDATLNPVDESEDTNKELEFDDFVNIARTSAGSVLVDGEYKYIDHTFAKCCNPIPGDPIVGYITIGSGIKIHRRDCKNLHNMLKSGENKLVPVNWPRSRDSKFVAGIAIRGEDKPGVLNDISNNVSSYKNTNIKSININAVESMFEGAITVYVEGLEHLNRLIERIKKIPGVYSVNRFDANV